MVRDFRAAVTGELDTLSNRLSVLSTRLTGLDEVRQRIGTMEIAMVNELRATAERTDAQLTAIDQTARQH